MSEDKSAEDVTKDLIAVRAWTRTQPHLPQHIDDKILRRFLHSCYHDLDKTKKCMEVFFTLRANSPEIFSQRDPTSLQMKEVFESMNLALIRLKDQSNLFICQLNDVSNFNHLAMVRVLLSQYDCWMMDDEHLETRDLVIMDAKNISMRLIFKVNMAIAKKMGQYEQEAMPLRLKGCHMINAPTYVDRLFSIMKTIIKPEMSELFHFHAPNTDTLYQFINKEELPVDFGGQAASMDTHMKEWVQKMEKHRDFLMDGKQWTADESLRIKEAPPAKRGYWF